MKIHRLVYIFIAVVVAGLLFANGCLLKQNIDYKSANRHLILQNDSLISLIIDMNRKNGHATTDSALIPELSQILKK